MKKLMFIVTVLALFVCTNLQGQSFEKGNSALNLGIGLGGVGVDAIGFSATYEVGVFPIGDGFGLISIGGLFGYKPKKNFYSSIGLAPRGIFHFTVIPVEKLDVYAAVAPFTVVITKVTIGGSSSSSTSTDIFNTSVGARYFFSENMAVFAETGYTFNYLTGGISFKF